tara:strand:+ start:30 stop:608 length:579 start_codon:yes stop_codon:yes gene_type:complete
MPQESIPEEAELKASIQAAIAEIAADKELLKVKSLSRHNPMKVAEILYLYSIGKSQTQIVKKYNIQRATVIQVLVDYADHLGQLREVAGKIAAKNYMQLSSLEEDLVDKVRDRMENDPDMEVSFRDIKELSIAKSNAFRETMTTRGEATQITEERKVITQEDYEDTLKAAKERLESMKRVDQAEIIEETNND